MITIGIIFMGISIVTTLINLRIRHQQANERKSAAERRRRENSRIVALRKCGAEIVRIDELAKEEISRCVPDKWPQPLEVGECFISCGKSKGLLT